MLHVFVHTGDPLLFASDSHSTFDICWLRQQLVLLKCISSNIALASFATLVAHTTSNTFIRSSASFHASWSPSWIRRKNIVNHSWHAWDFWVINIVDINCSCKECYSYKLVKGKTFQKIPQGVSASNVLKLRILAFKCIICQVYFPRFCLLPAFFYPLVS